MGSGTPPNLPGLLNTSGHPHPRPRRGLKLDAIAKTKADLRKGASFTELDAIVTDPTNLATIQTSKDSQGRYIVNDPAAPGPEQLFGLRVVATPRSR